MDKKWLNEALAFGDIQEMLNSTDKTSECEIYFLFFVNFITVKSGKFTNLELGEEISCGDHMRDFRLVDSMNDGLFS